MRLRILRGREHEEALAVGDEVHAGFLDPAGAPRARRSCPTSPNSSPESIRLATSIVSSCVRRLAKPRLCRPRGQVRLHDGGIAKGSHLGFEFGRIYERSRSLPSGYGAARRTPFMKWTSEPSRRAALSARPRRWGSRGRKLVDEARTKRSFGTHHRQIRPYRAGDRERISARTFEHLTRYPGLGARRAGVAGSTITRETAGDPRSRTARACSRAPEPTTSTTLLMAAASSSGEGRRKGPQS